MDLNEDYFTKYCHSNWKWVFLSVILLLLESLFSFECFSPSLAASFQCATCQPEFSRIKVKDLKVHRYLLWFKASLSNIFWFLFFL